MQGEGGCKRKRLPDCADPPLWTVLNGWVERASQRIFINFLSPSMERPKPIGAAHSSDEELPGCSSVWLAQTEATTHSLLLVGASPVATLLRVPDRLTTVRAQSWLAIPDELRALGTRHEVTARKEENLSRIREAHSAFPGPCICGRRRWRLHSSQDPCDGFFRHCRGWPLDWFMSNADRDEIAQLVSHIIREVGLASGKSIRLPRKLSTQAVVEQGLSLAVIKGRQACKQLQEDYAHREDVGRRGVGSHSQDLWGLVSRGSDPGQSCSS